MILYILLGVIVLFVIVVMLATRESNQKAIIVGDQILQMEQNYNKYVENYFTAHTLNRANKAIVEDELVKEVMTVILPEIRGILSFVNVTIYASMTIPIKANYFPNLVPLTEEYFDKSRKNKSKKISQEEEVEYIAIIEDAVRADLKKRLLDLDIAAW